MMLKKIGIGILLVAVLGMGILYLLAHSIRMDWGHHFSFENQLDFQIDSLEITVGNKTTLILARQDSLKSLEGNIDVPQDGYPHKVSLRIYGDEETLTLHADSFNCYTCDGNHEYKLKRTGATYRFRN